MQKGESKGRKGMRGENIHVLQGKELNFFGGCESIVFGPMNKPMLEKSEITDRKLIDFKIYVKKTSVLVPIFFV
jgi:hypothetical protein